MKQSCLPRMILVLVLCLLSIGCTIPIPTVQPLTRIDPVEEVRTVELGGAAHATVRLRLLSEELRIQPAATADFFRGVFRYNVQEWSPDIDQKIDGDVLELTVGQGMGSQIPIGLDDDYDNAWEIALSRGVPIDLGVDMGAGTADLDLSGISLTKLSLTTGAADTMLAFYEPNPEPLSMLRISTGTGNTTITGLGNANIDQFNLIGGTGSVTVDFNGTLTRSALVDLKAGAGEFDVRVPDAVGVRVTFLGTPISTIDTMGFTETDDNVFINGAYGQSSLTLTIKITAGVGKVSLISQ